MGRLRPADPTPGRPGQEVDMVAQPGTAEPAAGSADRFGLVFLLLISIFVLGALFASPRAQAAILLVYVVVLLLVLRAVGIRRGIGPLLRIALSLGSLVVFAVAWAVPGDRTAGALALWLSAVLLATIALIVRRLLHHRAVTVQTLFGALSAYLLIGFLFAALYSAVARRAGGARRSDLPGHPGRSPRGDVRAAAARAPFGPGGGGRVGVAAPGWLRFGSGRSTRRPVIRW